MPLTMQTKLYTLGYESAAVDDFVATLKHVGVERVIDVRELPLSRRKGFSKNVLRALLNANGIEYVHLRGLGDPKEGRDAAKAGNHKTFLRIFSAHMKTEIAQGDLSTAVDLATAATTCLLCYERSPDECHRTIVAHAIVEATGQKVAPIGVRAGLAKQQGFVPDLPEYGHA